MPISFFKALRPFDFHSLCNFRERIKAIEYKFQARHNARNNSIVLLGFVFPKTNKVAIAAPS